MKTHIAPLNLEKDVACIAGAVEFTREEVMAAINPQAFVDAKADVMRRSFVKGITKEINARGWASIPTTEE